MSHFEWDEKKEQSNIKKHGVSFYEAQQGFLDPSRIILEDGDHRVRHLNSALYSPKK